VGVGLRSGRRNGGDRAVSTKYSTGPDSRILTGQDGRAVALTDHALDRWRARTPADIDIGVRRAWQLGDHIKHCSVASADDQPDPVAVRVFQHSDGWTAIFLVVDDGEPAAAHEAPRVVATVYNLQTLDHIPSREYVAAYGPHDLGDQPC